MAGIDDLFGEEEVEEEPRKTTEEDEEAKRLKKTPWAVTAKPSKMHDHESETWDVIDAFEQKAWSNNNMGIPTGYDQLDEAFDGGAKTGWIVVAGDSNIGKTGWISQWAWNMAMKNRVPVKLPSGAVRRPVYVMDFSLDDPMHDKIPRVVASANKVLINAVKTPNDYLHMPDMLKRRQKGMEMLRDGINCYRPYDATFSTDFEKIKDEIRRVKVMLDEAGEDRQLIVFIDNFHDLETDHPNARGGDKQKYDWLAKQVSDMATEFDIPVITSAEFKKLNGFRRPGVDDIRESVKIKYEAKAILLCYNEVSLKGEGASIYFERKGNPAKQPIFEVKVQKNKLGDRKPRIFYEFYPELAYFEEADLNTAKKYNNLIYSNE